MYLERGRFRRATIDSAHLAVTFDVTFKASFASSGNPKSLYIFGQGSQGSSYNVYGSWTVAVSSVAPSIVSLSPSAGSGSAQTFAATYADPNGGMDIQETILLIQDPSSPNGANQCIVRFDPPSNQLYLLVDQAGTWLGPVQAGNSAQSLQNSQCVLSGGSSGSSNGTNLMVDFEVSFKDAFAGAKGLFLFGQNPYGTVYNQVGTWTVTSSAVQFPDVSLTPPSTLSTPPPVTGSTCPTLAGIWSENITPPATWNFLENGLGTLVQPNAVQGCPTLSWQATFQLSQGNTFDVHAFNPSPSSLPEGCELPVINIQGTVTLQNGCMRGTATITTSEGTHNSTWVDPQAGQMLTSLSLSLGRIVTYLGNPFIDCGGSVLPGPHFGYRRCGTYTALDQAGHPMQNSAALSASESVIKISANYQADNHTANATFINAQILDTLSLIEGQPLSAGLKGVFQQTITVTIPAPEE